MNENDLFEVLAAPSREKLAGVVGDFVRTNAHVAGEAIKKHKAPLIAAGTGAGLLTLAQYLQNRPDKSGTSGQQRLSQRIADSAHTAKAEADASGKPSFTKDMTDAMAPSVKNVSDVLAKHPGKGALLAAPLGASAGWALAQRFMRK